MAEELASRIVRKDWVKKAAGDFQTYKATGADRIYPTMLQKGWEKILTDYIGIGKRSFTLGYTPRTWFKVRCVFTPKPGKEDYSNPGLID